MIQTIKTLLAVFVIVTTVGFVAANGVILQASAAGGCHVGQGVSGQGQGSMPGHVLDTPGTSVCVPFSEPNNDVPP
jgi:hypothetical protein